MHCGIDSIMTTPSAQLRKIKKPMIERRRRERINECLNQLKSLVLEATKKDESRYSKMEKADILEMTVTHLKALHRSGSLHLREQQQQQQGTLVESGGRYAAGFRQCAVEVSRYLADSSAISRTDLEFSPHRQQQLQQQQPALATARLMRHLTALMLQVSSARQQSTLHPLHPPTPPSSSPSSSPRHHPTSPLLPPPYHDSQTDSAHCRSASPAATSSSESSMTSFPEETRTRLMMAASRGLLSSCSSEPDDDCADLLLSSLVGVDTARYQPCHDDVTFGWHSSTSVDRLLNNKSGEDDGKSLPAGNDAEFYRQVKPEFELQPLDAEVWRPW